MSVMINEIPVDMIINTGASVDILDETAYRRVNYNGKIILQPSTKRLFVYGSKSQLHNMVVLKLLSHSGTIAQLLCCMY